MCHKIILNKNQQKNHQVNNGNPSRRHKSLYISLKAEGRNHGLRFEKPGYLLGFSRARTLAKRRTQPLQNKQFQIIILALSATAENIIDTTPITFLSPSCVDAIVFKKIKIKNISRERVHNNL